MFEKVNNMDIEKRKKIIEIQLYIVTTLITITTMVLIFFSIKQIQIGVFFSGAFLFALCFWEIGCALADNMLEKKNKK